MFYKPNTKTIKIKSCNHRGPSTTTGVATNAGIRSASIGEIKGRIVGNIKKFELVE